ncbi:MAG: Ig-like domain-containing protein [Gemmatimonadaceae bacterium]
MRILRTGSAALLVLAIDACSSAKVMAPPAPLTVMIEPSSVTAAKNVTITLSVIVKDSSGTVLVPDSVRWRSSDSTKASVSVTGVLRTIQATSPTISIQATAFKGRAQGSASIPVAITAFP